MTSNDAPRPGAHAARRRTLGRGPGMPPVAPPPQETAPTEPTAPAGAQAPETVSETEPVRAAGEATGRAAGSDAGRVGREGGAQGGSGASTGARAGVAGARHGSTDPERAPRNATQAPGAVRTAPATEPEGPGPSPGAGEPPHGDPQDTPHDGAEAADADGGVFKVRLANFEGPFDLLLQLIAKHKMDVTEVALSRVTDEFMAHIRAMGPDWDLDETTEFLVVAATLLDLKAARLLPAAEVEDEADLALLEARDLLFARLLQYRAYKQIAEIFNERVEAEARRHPRTVGLEPHHAELLPEVVIGIGPEGFARLAVKAMQPKPKPQVYVEHIHAPLVSVQEQAGIVVARLRELGEASFRVLVDDTGDTLTVVARFLALLELYREKAVALDQETALGELLVRWTGGDGDVGAVVTDEFDRAPRETEEEQE